MTIQGKIYKIVSPNINKFYIGSTTLSLAQRFNTHLTLFKKCTSKIIIDAGDATIELFELIELSNKSELLKREGELIRLYKSKDLIVNKNIPGRTINQWRIENREKIKAYNKNYYNNKKDKINLNIIN